MAEYEINLTGDQVKGLLTSDDGLKGLVEDGREPGIGGADERGGSMSIKSFNSDRFTHRFAVCKSAG